VTPRQMPVFVAVRRRRRPTAGGALPGWVTEANATLREGDRLRLKILVFSSPPHARRFWNTSFIGRYGTAESASGRPNRVSGSFTAWVHATESDRRFFAVAVFAGPPTLADIAHEAVHVARRYVERVGIRKDWGTADGYEIGDPEEQTAYAAGAAAGLMAEAADMLKDEMSNEKEDMYGIPHEDKSVQAENAAAVGVVVVGARGGGLRRPEGGRAPGGARPGGRPTG